jgi:hypothetical protein
MMFGAYSYKSSSDVGASEVIGVFDEVGRGNTGVDNVFVGAAIGVERLEVSGALQLTTIKPNSATVVINRGVSFILSLRDILLTGY